MLITSVCTWVTTSQGSPYQVFSSLLLAATLAIVWATSLQWQGTYETEKMIKPLLIFLDRINNVPLRRQILLLINSLNNRLSIWFQHKSTSARVTQVSHFEAFPSLHTKTSVQILQLDKLTFGPITFYKAIQQWIMVLQLSNSKSKPITH